MKTLSALEFRRKFGSVLDLVARDREPVTICRANKPMAVLVPADEFAGDRSRRSARLERTLAKLADWRRCHRRQVSRLDSIQLLRESREER
jgi:prevent-host-death family protein